MAEHPPNALDTRRTVETPEGVTLELAVAGPFVRAQAWVVDFVLRTLVGWIVAIPLALLGRTGSGILLLLLFLGTARAAERVRIEIDGLDRDLRRNVLASLSLEEARGDKDLTEERIRRLQAPAPARAASDPPIRS